MNKLAIAVFALALALVGCGDTTFNGQAFIKDKGATKKLSDMEVMLTTSKDLLNRTDSYKENIGKIISTFQSENSTLNNIMERKKSYEGLASAFLSNEGALKPLDPSILPSVQKALEEIDSVYKTKRNAQSNDFAQLKDASHPAIYYDPTSPSIKLKVRTDAEGKFSFKAKDDDDSVLVAKQGGNYWYVIIPKESHDIALADSNLHNSKCPTCLFTLERTSALRSELSTYAAKKMEASSATTLKSDATAAEDTFTKEVETLSKNMKGIPKRVGDIERFKGLVDLVAAGGGMTSAMRASNAQDATRLNIDVVNYRAKNDELLKELNKRVAALHSELALLR